MVCVHHASHLAVGTGWGHSNLSVAEQLRESRWTDGEDAARFLPPSLCFPPTISFPFSPPTSFGRGGGGRGTWTSTCLMSKLNSPSNYFLSLCRSNLSSLQTDGNCCCTAALALAKPVDKWQAGVMLVWLTNCKENKEENSAYGLRRARFGSCSCRMAGGLIRQKFNIYLPVKT